MKNIVIIVLGFVSIFDSLNAIDFYVDGSTLYVWANSGLNIRASRNASSEKLVTIPYGDSILVLESKYSHFADKESIILIRKDNEVIEHQVGKVSNIDLRIKGRWVKVKYREIEGFVFDGFLSNHQAPKQFKRALYNEGLEGYIKSKFGEAVEIKEVANKTKDFRIKYQYFRGGIVKRNKFSKAADVQYSFPKFSIQEIVLLLTNSPLKMQNLKLIKNEEFDEVTRLEFVYGYTGKITITYTDGVVIVSSYENC